VDSTEINAEILLLTLELWAELTFAWPQMITKSFDKPCGPTVWIEQIEGLFNIGRVDIPHGTFNGGLFEDSQSFENALNQRLVQNVQVVQPLRSLLKRFRGLTCRCDGLADLFDFKVWRINKLSMLSV